MSQVSQSSSVQVSAASVQVQPETRANVTQLRTSSDQHIGYPAPQPLVTGNDVIGSRQRQPEVQQVHAGNLY